MKYDRVLVFKGKDIIHISVKNIVSAKSYQILYDILVISKKKFKQVLWLFSHL